MMVVLESLRLIFDTLLSYVIPDSQTKPWSAPAHGRMTLNLFAGQLYFDSKEESESLCARAAGAADGASRSRIQRSGWVCAAGASYRVTELSVHKEQDTHIEEISCTATKGQGLPFDTFGTSVG